ncbi:MAG: sigma-70 family RNA polymerase sigma factor [Deltaproteobacteria bacterium]|nr:sigma-70 family RNA polymerase sigma factor [Deltaproteobacteria bacterium]
MTAELDTLGAFLAAFPGKTEAAPGGPLAVALGETIAAARSAHPQIAVDDPTFAAYLAERLDPDAGPGVQLGKLDAPDLYLACGCLHADPVAVADFDGEPMSVVIPAIRGMRGDLAAAEDIAQEIRERLLVGGGERGPRIADYKGRGRLKRWVKAIAVRTFLNNKRGQKREVLVDDEPVLDSLTEPSDPQLALLKDKYRAQFSTSFASAMESLSSEDKLVLRHAHIDNLRLEEIGKALGVSRATAHRRLIRAREALAKATEDQLGRTLGVSAGEVASIRRLVQSQVVVSVRRLLSDD